MFLAGTILGATLHAAFQNLPERYEELILDDPIDTSTEIVAVDTEGRGVTADLSVEIQPDGRGNVFLTVRPLTLIDLQHSADTAARVAARNAGGSLDETNVSFTIDAGEVELVGGPSAGAAMAVTTLAAIQEKEIRENVVITGGIREDSSISQVGGILPKAASAEESGKDLFLVPEGQSVVRRYQEREIELGPITYITEEPIEVDVNEFAEEQGWDLEVREVTDLEEAAEYMVKY